MRQEDSGKSGLAWIARIRRDAPDEGSWCRGLTCLPVTEEIAGSNPVGPAKKRELPSGSSFFLGKHRLRYEPGSAQPRFDHKELTQEFTPSKRRRG
jgi:hypothetical protein